MPQIQHSYRMETAKLEPSFCCRIGSTIQMPRSRFQLTSKRVIGRRKLDSVELEDKPSDWTRISTGRSSAGTCHTEPSQITGRCLLGSVPISGGFPPCWRAWRPFVQEYATRSRATLGPLVVRTISFLQPKACVIALDCAELGGAGPILISVASEKVRGYL